MEIRELFTEIPQGHDRIVTFLYLVQDQKGPTGNDTCTIYDSQITEDQFWMEISLEYAPQTGNTLKVAIYHIVELTSPELFEKIGLSAMTCAPQYKGFSIGRPFPIHEFPVGMSLHGCIFFS
jgi:hypothetical protein